MSESDTQHLITITTMTISPTIIITILILLFITTQAIHMIIILTTIIITGTIIIKIENIIEGYRENLVLKMIQKH